MDGPQSHKSEMGCTIIFHMKSRINQIMEFGVCACDMNIRKCILFYTLINDFLSSYFCLVFYYKYLKIVKWRYIHLSKYHFYINLFNHVCPKNPRFTWEEKNLVCFPFELFVFSLTDFFLVLSIKYNFFLKLFLIKQDLICYVNLYITCISI